MQRPESVDLGPEHGDALKAALWSLLECDSLTDVTLVAADAEGGGGRVRAHRVVLAAASKYFRDLLTSPDVSSSPGQCSSPVVICMRDAPVRTLRTLVRFLYLGRAEIPGEEKDRDSFLRLTKSLGIPVPHPEGSRDEQEVFKLPKVPAKRKHRQRDEEENEEDKENTKSSAGSSPLKHASSEPVSLDGVPAGERQLQQLIKKRKKLQARSLDEMAQLRRQRRRPLSVTQSTPSSSEVPSPSPLTTHGAERRDSSSVSSPGEVVLTPFWTSAPISFVMPEASSGSPRPQAGGDLREVELADVGGPLPSPAQSTSHHHPQAVRHPSSASCPDRTAAAVASSLTKSSATYPGTFSSSRHPDDLPAALLDPGELAAKGATLLHHLALWMMEEKRAKEQQQRQQQQGQHQPVASKGPEATYANVGPDGSAVMPTENVYCNIDEVSGEPLGKPQEVQPATRTQTAARKQTSLPLQLGISLPLPPSATGPSLPPLPSLQPLSYSQRGRNASGATTSDRPDSGFDSNREEAASMSATAATTGATTAAALEEEEMAAEAEAEAEEDSSASSPEAAEMSRRAPIRQPVFRKRRTHLH